MAIGVVVLEVTIKLFVYSYQLFYKYTTNAIIFITTKNKLLYIILYPIFGHLPSVVCET